MAIHKVIRRTPSNHNPFSADIRNIGQSVTNQFEEALVMDTIINDEHILYSKDGYNVGSIQFKFTTTNAYTPDTQLNWAYPIDSNITSYPLKNEVVYVVSILNRFYYTRININNQLTNQSFPELADSLQSIPSQTQQSSTTRQRAASPTKQSPPSDLLGTYFLDNPKNYRLKHFEGDFILEGRTGQSIRFGSTWKSNRIFTATNKDQSPNLLLRVGDNDTASPSVNTPNGIIMEDINGDKSSIWLTSDQIVPITVASNGKKIQTASDADVPAQFDGAQIIANSDRIVINTKLNSLLLSSIKDINQISLRNHTIDTDGDFVTWTNGNRRDRVFGNWTSLTKGDFSVSVSGNVLFIGSKFYLGGQSGSQPMVLGQDLVGILSSLIDIITGSPIVLLTSKPGNSSQLNPITKAKLKQLKSKLRHILSSDNFVTKTNSPKSLGSYKES